MEELPSSENSNSIENTVASMRRECDHLQHDMEQDMRYIVDEVGKNNNRFAAQLQSHYQSKTNVSLRSVDSNLSHLLEMRKDIETTRRRIQAFSANSAKISSDGPASAASGGPRLHKITPHAVREDREGGSGILADAAVVESAVSVAMNNQDQVDVRGVMSVKSVTATVDGSRTDESIGEAACKLEYDAAGNADLGFGLGFGGIMAVEGAKRGNATRKRAKQGVEDQQQPQQQQGQGQGGKAQKQKTGSATPVPVAEAVDMK